MLFDDGPVASLLLEEVAEGRSVGTLGEPEPFRKPPKTLHILADSGANLGLDRLRNPHQKREKAVCCGACDDLKMTAIAKTRVNLDEIPLPFIDKESSQTIETVLVETG